jgi:hypothetical protein
LGTTFGKRNALFGGDGTRDRRRATDGGGGGRRRWWRHRRKERTAPHRKVKGATNGGPRVWRATIEKRKATRSARVSFFLTRAAESLGGAERRRRARWRLAAGADGIRYRFR